jgi:hypothetical protein
MNRRLQEYLDQVLIYADRNPQESGRIRAELGDHLLEKMAHLEADGMSQAEAVSRALGDHGKAETISYALRRRFRWVDVRRQGTARGFIAIGPRAIGVLAVGGVACGVCAYGGIAVGMWSFGGLALALLIAAGGVAAAPLGLAIGALAIGMTAFAGIAVGATTCSGLFAGHILPFPPDRFTRPIVQSAPPLVAGLFVLDFWLSCFAVLSTGILLVRRERKRIASAELALTE